MNNEYAEFWKWWKNWGIHVEALFILIAMVGIIYVYVDNSNLQKEIKVSCGWEPEEDMFCSCKRDIAHEWKAEAEAQMNPFLSIPNLSKDGIRE